MKRKLIRDIRHDEFIQATLKATYAKGFHAVTMSEIARQVGATAASINYYFGSKEQLMVATMRHLLIMLSQAHRTRLATAQTPKDRLRALIEANFDEALFTPEHCSFWVQFWAAAPYSDSLARLQRINQARVASHFRHELKQLAPAHIRRAIERMLQSYMDGVWLNVAQNKRPITAAHARQESRALLDLVLSQAHSPRG